MNYKTMRGLLTIGIRVRHESWRAPIYLYREGTKYLLHTEDFSDMPIDPAMYNPERSSLESELYYIAKYVKGWEIYDESKSQQETI